MSPTQQPTSATDLQPGTRNPQTTSDQVLAPPQTLQSADQSNLLENKQATIQVPKNPAPASQQTPSTGAGSAAMWWMVIAALLAMVAAILFWRRWRQPLSTPESPAEAVAPAPVSAIAEPDKVAVPPKSKKPAPKKSKSKRKKRARR